MERGTTDADNVVNRVSELLAVFQNFSETADMAGIIALLQSKRVVGISVAGDATKILTLTFNDGTVLLETFTDNNSGTGGGISEVTLTNLVTLSNKSLSGLTNTFTNIPQAAVTGLVSALANALIRSNQCRYCCR